MGLYDIDRSLKPKRIQLFLLTPSDVNIGKIADSNNKKQTIKFVGVNELSFSIPYDIIINNKLQRNPIVDRIRERFIIKVVLGDIEERYIITKKEPSSNDEDWLNIQCFSLEYELTYKKMIGYSATSYNCLQVSTDCLKDTNWKIGYINPEFNLKYKQFDVSSATKLDFINQICDAFKAFVTFDTVNKLLNFWKEEELSVYKGFWIEFGKYLQSIDESIDIDQIVTRLHVSGGDGVSVNSVNPTGQSYMDDFSYFLYPFDRDVNRNVLNHSYFMSDDLCHAILDYNTLVDANETSFQSLLTTRITLQEDLSTLNNDLATLNEELREILDNITIAKNTHQSTTTLIQQRNDKQTQINTKKSEIDAKQVQINSNDKSISDLNDVLKIENNFSSTLLSELTDYIFEDEFSDDNQINNEDLYNAGVDYLKTVNIPPINLSLGIINFFEVIEEQHNWDKLSIGDIIKVKHNKLNIDVKAKISEISFDYESTSISLTVSNVKRPDSIEQKITNALYTIDKVNTDYNKRKINWESVTYNYNLRNDRIKTTPSKPILLTDGTTIENKLNDNGSVDLTLSWTYGNYTKTKKDADNIDGFLVYLYADDTNDAYVFGSQMANETMVDLTSDKRKYTFPSVPPNLYYTLGIRAYRRVDNDINSEGILLSDIISPTLSSENPYQPSPKVSINGDVNGKLNGATHIVSDVEPIVPQKNDVWIDTTDKKTKVYDGMNWNVNSADAESISGFYTDKLNIPNTIPVRGENGLLDASITGDAQTLDGKSSEEFVLKTDLPIIPSIMTGTYIGDGTQNKEIVIGFHPSIVRVYTTKNNDMSAYINSDSGGYLLKNNANTTYLEGVGTDLDLESNIYGKLSPNGFFTGNSIDTYINKLNAKYFWEAIKYTS